MNSKDLQNALSNVDDKYIAESAVYRKGSRSLKVWRIIAIAACCLIALPLTAIAAFVISDSASSGKSGAIRHDEYYVTEAETAAEAAAGGAYSSNSSWEAAPEAAEYEEEGYYYDEDKGTAITGDSQSQNSGWDTSAYKIIRTADVGIQTTEYDSSVSLIDSIAQEYGAYFEYKNMSDGSGYRYSSYSLRVPSENYDRFIAALKDAGTITYQYENSTDVSDSYRDIESRLKTAKTKLERLQELLSEAEDMSDIITIEEAISETEWEIEDLQGSLNSYDSKVNYSTVYIDLNEVYKVDQTDTPRTFSEKFSAAFKDGLQSFRYAMEDLAFWFAESWIWLLIVGAVIAGAIIVPIACVRAARKRRNR